MRLAGILALSVLLLPTPALAVDAATVSQLSELTTLSLSSLDEKAAQCVGGLTLDSGIFENGGRSPFVTDARYVELFTPSFYPAVLNQICICWKSGLDPAAMNYSVVAYDDNGAGGIPGTLLGTKGASISIPTAFGEGWTDTQCADVGITVTSGSVYLGAQFNSSSNPDFFICLDEAITTPARTMFRSANGGFSWTPVAQDFSDARALGVRAEVVAVPEDPDPPVGVAPILSSQYPNFRFWVRIADTRIGTATSACLPETVCVAGAIPTRAEVFVRIVGPKGNGYLWPNVVKFNTTKTEVWIQQISTGETQYYLLPALATESETLPGLVDKTGFLP